MAAVCGGRWRGLRSFRRLVVVCHLRFAVAPGPGRSPFSTEQHTACSHGSYVLHATEPRHAFMVGCSQGSSPCLSACQSASLHGEASFVLSCVACPVVWDCERCRRLHCVHCIAVLLYKETGKGGWLREKEGIGTARKVEGKEKEYRGMVPYRNGDALLSGR